MTFPAIWPSCTDTSTRHCRTPSWTRLSSPSPSASPRSTSGAIGETKRFVDVASLAPDFEIAPEWDVCLASIARPAAQERIRMLLERGFHQPGDVEDRLGYHVGQLGR